MYNTFTLPGIEKANDLMYEANMLILKVWLEEIVFSWRWWLEIAILILPWIFFWFFLRNKEDTYRLVGAGLFVMLVVTYMDTIGMALHLWGYPTKEVPLIPPYLTWDLSVIPVLVMAFLHYKPEVNPIWKSIILGLIGSLIIQPFAVIMGLYIPHHWKHYYSFPIAIVIYLAANYFYNYFDRKK